MPPKGAAGRRDLCPLLGSGGTELIPFSGFPQTLSVCARCLWLRPAAHSPSSALPRLPRAPLQRVTRTLHVHVRSEKCVSPSGHVPCNWRGWCCALARAPFPSPPSAVWKMCPAAVRPPAPRVRRLPVAAAASPGEDGLKPKAPCSRLLHVHRGQRTVAKHVPTPELHLEVTRISPARVLMPRVCPTGPPNLKWEGHSVLLCDCGKSKSRDTWGQP